MSSDRALALLFAFVTGLEWKARTQQPLEQCEEKAPLTAIVSFCRTVSEPTSHVFPFLNKALKTTNSVDQQ